MQDVFPFINAFCSKSLCMNKGWVDVEETVDCEDICFDFQLSCILCMRVL